MTFTDLFIRGLVAHIVADWFAQNEWMALNKTSLKHPAAYVHSGIHLLAALFVFPWPVAVVLGIAHLFIDTRKPLQWWRGLIKQTNDPANPVFISFAMWQDQMAHVLCIAAAAWFVAK